MYRFIFSTPEERETKSVKAGLLTRASSYFDPSHTRAVKPSCTVVSQNRQHLQLRVQFRIFTGFPIKSKKDTFIVKSYNHYM